MVVRGGASAGSLPRLRDGEAFPGPGWGRAASLGFAMERPFRGLAVAGRPALRAAAPPGLRPLGRHPACGRDGGSRPDRLPNPPRRARKTARSRGGPAGAGSVPASGRRRGFAERRPPARTDCAETAGAHGLRGDRRCARRGPRAAIARSAGAAWGNAVDPVVSADRPRMGPAATEGPQAGEPKASRQGPEGERIKQPSPKEALAPHFPPPEGERIRQPSAKGARGPAARLLLFFALRARIRCAILLLATPSSGDRGLVPRNQ